ncbi:MAG: SAM-dependent methyltransferase [Anaerolineales bacterium]|nr:SAM-dependent methyltransferase [Anaerolineales bacterium]
MFYVALEQYQPNSHRLIRDEVARRMLPGRLNLLLSIFGIGPVRQGFLRLIEWSSPGMRSTLCRKRYIDDKLVEALGSGIDAVVILGSGLDTRAYRIPQISTVRVYEIDLPQMISYKEGKLRQLYGSVPPHVKLIPIDFDRQHLEDALKDHGYSFDQTSFIIWEGVTQYISETAVRAVLESLAKVRQASRMVFTYITKDFIDGERKYGLERLSRRTRGLWRFGLHPSQTAAFIGKYAWKELEQVGADEYRQRYLDPMGITVSVMEIERTVYAEKRTT